MRLKWAQNQFPYYGIQSQDVVQEPRVALENSIYRSIFRGTNFSLILREWELTNTRYFIGLSGEFITMLNQQLDPGKSRFRSLANFELTVKNPNIKQPQGEDITTVLTTNGHFAIIEFTGALPRAKLYSQWTIETNRTQILKNLADLKFDPNQKVIIEKEVPSSGVSANVDSGSVEIIQYSHKKVDLRAKVNIPSVLLLNDKYDADWKVFVDGQLQPLLRCNYIMKGVYLQPGATYNRI